MKDEKFPKTNVYEMASKVAEVVGRESCRVGAGAQYIQEGNGDDRGEYVPLA